MADNRKLLLVYLTVVFLITAVRSAADFDSTPGWMIRPGSGSGSRTIGEFLSFEEEYEVDSEIHRRILVTTNYISYGALNKDRVPCSRRGASYYNCRPGAQANPYRRGCSAITRCLR